MTAQLEKVLYTANTHTTGGRDGAARSDDGRLNVTLSSPGTAGAGTNPEQLFATTELLLGLFIWWRRARPVIAGIAALSLVLHGKCPSADSRATADAP